jgi:hypothetical protein
MVGSTLCNKAKDKNSIVTSELYEKELGGAKRIIGNYLYNQLDEFGTMRPYAEEILKMLTYEGKKTPPRSRTELSADIKLKDEEFLNLLDLLVRKRVIRPLGDSYEIIHDYLAEMVEKELVVPKEKPLRHALNSLESKSSSYETFWNLLTPMEMIVLYVSREVIENTVKQDMKKRQLLLHSCLAGQGPAWWWFRKLEKSIYLPHIVDGLKSQAKVEGKSISIGAQHAFKNSVSHEDLPLINEMLIEPSWNVRRAAVVAFSKIGTRKDLPLIKKMLKDSNWGVRCAAVEAISKIGTREDLPLIKEALKDSNKDESGPTVQALGKIGSDEELMLLIKLLASQEIALSKEVVSTVISMDRRLYCPFKLAEE